MAGLREYLLLFVPERMNEWMNGWMEVLKDRESSLGRGLVRVVGMVEDH